MNGFSFKVGLHIELDGTAMQIERLQPDGQVLLSRQTDGQLLLESQPNLLQAYMAGKLQAITAATPVGEHPPSSVQPYGRPLVDLPARIQAELRRRKHYLDYLGARSGYVFTAVQLKPLIDEAAKLIADHNPPSPTSVYRWHIKLQASGDIRALVPRFDRRGRRELKQAERLLDLFTIAVEESYKSTPAATITTIEVRFHNLIDQENRSRLPNEQLRAPSRRTLYRLFDRLETYDKIVLQEGKGVADRRLRISKRSPEVSEILERVEVDHTPLDLFLIDDVTGLPLGRPTLTVAIDYFSRLPIGYYLSFGGTSTSAVMGVLRHAILPKKSCPLKVSGLVVEHDWPCYGLMQSLVIDNGMEFHSQDLESVALDLGIHLQFCPTRTPRFKGAIERFLKTINYNFTHQMPGTSLARFTERGDYDSAKHALLTLAELRHVTEKWLLDIYAQQIHRGIGTTPWAKWHDGAQRKALALPNSLAALQKRIGRVEERKLRHDGLWLQGIRYASDALQPVLRAWGEGVSIRIVYDPDDLGEIQVWPPEQETPLAIPAVHQEYACGLTMLQHDLLRQELRAMGRNAEDSAALMQAKQQLAQAIDTLMSSRKQRSRRKSAQIHGMNSEQPDRRFVAPKPMPQSKAVSIPSTQTDQIAGEQAIYSFFSKADLKKRA